MRWRSAAKNVVMVLVGVLVGLSVTQFLLQDVVSCSDPVQASVREQTRQINMAKEDLAPSESDSLSSKMTSDTPLSTDTRPPSKQPDVPPLPPFRMVQDQVLTEGKRPKTAKEELTMREPLYIGVVTANSYLKTRATAVNQTWGQFAPKIEFFCREGEKKHNLPIVSLPGVDDTYPPQKKVYHMLRYMHDHYINQFNWFMRADDDSYIRIPELLEFLSALDPSEDLYIGSPGMGRQEDLDRVKLLSHERYCMGGPGVIFSRALLIKLAPHLEDCLENEVVSYNEDVEVGRCVSRRLQVQCTWAYEMRKLFYTDYTKAEIFNSPSIYNDKKFTGSLSSHPFKNPDMIFRLHQFFLEFSVTKAEKELGRVKTELLRVQEITKKAKAFP